jgi:hypothetical protein
MKIALTLIILIAGIGYAQTDTTFKKGHIVQLGIGSIGYMNSYFLPGGAIGNNYTFKYIYIKNNGASPLKVSFLNVAFNYSVLVNKHGVQAQYTSTYFFNLAMSYQKLYNLATCNNFKLKMGFHGGINSILCGAPNIDYAPPFTSLYFFTGINMLISYSRNNFTVENKTILPCIMYGYFTGYQDFYKLTTPDNLLKSTKFASIFNNTEIENSLLVLYSGLYFKTIKIPLFISYTFVNHNLSVNNNLQEYRRNIICIGFIFKQK